MRTVKSAAIAALLSCSLITPAFAQVNPMAIQIQNPPPLGPQPGMQEVCNAYLNELNSMYAPRKFVSVAVENATYGITWGANPTSSQKIEGTEQPVGSQTGADASQASANLVNGQSPNIFTTNAWAVYGGGSTFKTNDTYTGVAQYIFSCTPTEEIAGSSTTRPETQPECVDRVKDDTALQQTPAFLAYASQQGNAFGAYCQDNRIQITVTGPSTTAPDYSLSKGFEGGSVPGIIGIQEGTGSSTLPYTDKNSAVQAVVCISPTRNPGTWRAVNSFAGGVGTGIGQCGTNTYNSLNPAGTPSNSLPSS